MSTAWVEAYGTAVAKYNQGASYRDVMEEAISKFVTDGTRISAVPRITYVSTSGRVSRQDLDVALRRHIVTQANQAKMRMVDARAAEFGHDLVWTSAHFGARPSHTDWQGQVYSMSGTHPQYPDFYEATGYEGRKGPYAALGDRLCGVNCWHTFAPYLPETKLPELPETMNGLTSEQHYQVTQQQRAMEREISKLKQEVILGQQAGLPMTQARLKLGHKQRQLKAHTDHYKLPRNYLRERAWGVEKQPRRLTSAKWLTDIKPNRSVVAKTINLRAVEKSDVEIVVMNGKRFLKPPKNMELDVLGNPSYLAFDGAIEQKAIFAGFKSRPKKELRIRYEMAKRHGGDPEKWSHSAGVGVLYNPVNGKLGNADIHWFECDNQVFTIRFKRWLKNE